MAEILTPVFPMVCESFTDEKDVLSDEKVAEFARSLKQAYPLGASSDEAAAVIFRNAWDSGFSLASVEWEYERLVGMTCEVLALV